MASTRRRIRQPDKSGQVERAVATAIARGEMVSVGVVHLVKNALVAGLSGVRNVGTDVGVVSVAAVRGSVRAAHELGSDLGMVAKGAIKGSLHAAEEIGGDLAAISHAAARGAVKAASDVGGDVARVA